MVARKAISKWHASERRSNHTLINHFATALARSYSSSYRISLREAKTEYNKNTNNDYNIDDDFNYSNSGINRGELASNALFACLFSGLIWAFCFCRAGAYARDLRRRDRDREARIREELAEQAGRDANQGEFSATAGTLVVV